MPFHSSVAFPNWNIAPVDLYLISLLHNKYKGEAVPVHSKYHAMQ